MAEYSSEVSPIEEYLREQEVSEEERAIEKRKREEFKEKLRYWRETGTPIAIPNSFRA